MTDSVGEKDPTMPGLARRLGAMMALGASGVGLYYLLRAEAGPPCEKCDVSAYDVAGNRQIDPSLIKYHELTRINAGVEKPAAIAIGADGDLYVGGNGRVVRFDSRGRRMVWHAVPGQVRCLAVGPGGVIYAGLDDRVAVVTVDGVKTWPAFESPSRLTCITVAGDRVWIADASRRLVTGFDLDGHIVGEIGGRDPSRNQNGLSVPSPHLDVAVANDGMVWVADPGRHRIEMYTPEGELRHYWGVASTAIEGFCGCCNPADFCLLPDGRVVTSEKSLPRVKVYTADGHLDAVVAGPDSFKKGTVGMDVAAGRDGHIYVLDPTVGVVRIYEANGGSR